MKLEHAFHVDEDIDAAWEVLNDVRRDALCMPGAVVDTVDGDDITGRCKVKLGPISLTYRGEATFVERDVVAHRIVLEGHGQDGANGRASLALVATLNADGPRTRVDLETDLKLTGEPAQFGRGVIADLSDRIAGVVATLLTQNLEAFPARSRIARRLTRPVTISGRDIDGTCTISCASDAVTVSNDVVGSPSVTVRATVDQILDLSQLRMRAMGLLPVGFFTGRGLRVLAAIASGNLQVRGLVTHPVTALRVIALLSVVS